MRSQQELWESMGWGIQFVHDTQIELTAIPKELHQDDLRTYFDEVSSYLAEHETLHSRQENHSILWQRPKLPCSSSVEFLQKK